MSAPESTDVVVRERSFDADPEDVWETLTDEVLLEQWLADEVELDLREGGRARFAWDDGRELDAEIERVEPAERLSWTWWADGEPPARVEFRLEPAGEGTRVVVIESRPGAVPWAPALSALARMHAQPVCA